MSTVNAIGGASSAWSTHHASRMAAMKEKMFSKVDSDGSGSVDQNELQTMLDDIAEKTGGTAGDAGELLKTMDSDGDGTLSSDELADGMKSLMPPPSSTVEFSQQRASSDASDLFSQIDSDGDGSISQSEFETALASSAQSGAQGPGGMPPPPPPGMGDDGSDSSDGSTSFGAKAASELKDLLAAMDSDGDGTISQSESQAFASQLANALDSSASASWSGSSGTSGDNGSSTSQQDGSNSEGLRGFRLSALRELVASEYAQAAAGATSTSTTSAIA